MPEADEFWKQRVAEVEKALTERYSGRGAWKTAHEQEGRIGRLLSGGDIETRLICARAI